MSSTQTETKKKFIGIRINYSDYLSVLTHVEKLDITVTDFLMSLILPVIDQQTKTKSEVSIPSVIQENKTSQSLKHEMKKTNSSVNGNAGKKLWSDENEKLLKSYLIKQ